MIACPNKDADKVVSGTKVEKNGDEEESKATRATSQPVEATSVTPPQSAFSEHIAAPRTPDLSETASETTFEALTEDEETEEEESSCFNESGVNSDEDSGSPEETGDSQQHVKYDEGMRAKKVKVQTPLQKEIQDPKLKKEVKSRKWKPQLKTKPKEVDPILTEFVDTIESYIKSTNLIRFLRPWLHQLFAMSDRPEDPVKELRKLLDSKLQNAKEDSGLNQMQNELKILMKKENIMRVEISKLKHLTHLLAPQIYDKDGNMILVPEPSIEEEEMVIEEEISEPIIESGKETTKHHKETKTGKALSKKAKAKIKGSSVSSTGSSGKSSKSGTKLTKRAARKTKIGKTVKK